MSLVRFQRKWKSENSKKGVFRIRGFEGSGVVAARMIVLLKKMIIATLKYCGVLCMGIWGRSTGVLEGREKKWMLGLSRTQHN